MRIVNLSANASGAVRAAQQGDLVIVVDVINMSTTAEGALEAGALAVFGVASQKSSLSVVNPKRVGYLAGLKAVENKTDIILVTEPRVGTDEERKANAFSAILGMEEAGAKIGAILPNIGAETIKLTSWENRVVVLATDSGGVVFDAALNNGSPLVLTGTIARTLKQKGNQAAKRIAREAVKKAGELNCQISVVAASSNALEDVLAGEYIARCIMEEGF